MMLMMIDGPATTGLDDQQVEGAGLEGTCREMGKRKIPYFL
jgi:hypothetical protein